MHGITKLVSDYLPSLGVLACLWLWDEWLPWLQIVQLMECYYRSTDKVCEVQPSIPVDQPPNSCAFENIFSRVHNFLQSLL